MPRPLCELDAIIGANGVDLPGNSPEHVLQDVPGGALFSLLDALAERVGCGIEG